MSIHADLLIHGSLGNPSSRRRCGLTLRYCASDCVPLNRLWAKQAVHCRGTTDAAVWPPVARPEGEDLRPQAWFQKANEDCMRAISEIG